MGGTTKEAFEHKFDFRLEEEAGASLAHNQINRNLLGIFWLRLKDSCCEPFASDMPVFSAAKGGIYLPDVVVACEPRVEDCEVEIVDRITKDTKRRIRKALVNPVLIAEVWSVANKDPEKETKLSHYEQIESLQHYLTIEQTGRKVLHYRKENGQWTAPVEFLNNSEVRINGALDFSFVLDDLYSKILLEG